MMIIIVIIVTIIISMMMMIIIIISSSSSSSISIGGLRCGVELRQGLRLRHLPGPPRRLQDAQVQVGTHMCVYIYIYIYHSYVILYYIILYIIQSCLPPPPPGLVGLVTQSFRLFRHREQFDHLVFVPLP